MIIQIINNVLHLRYGIHRHPILTRKFRSFTENKYAFNLYKHKVGILSTIHGGNRVYLGIWNVPICISTAFVLKRMAVYLMHSTFDAPIQLTLNVAL